MSQRESAPTLGTRQADALSPKSEEKPDTGPAKLQSDLYIVLEDPVRFSDLSRQVAARATDLGLPEEDSVATKPTPYGS